MCLSILEFQGAVKCKGVLSYKQLFERTDRELKDDIKLNHSKNDHEDVKLTETVGSGMNVLELLG
jgi:hypothetical protein